MLANNLLNESTELKKRLESVILSLEKQQEMNYNPVTTLLLSYLIDIRDGKVPDYVIQNYEYYLHVNKITERSSD